MQIVVGLGNPGEKYKNNRHNVGFMFIDYIKDKNTALKKDNKFDAELFINNEIILAKPQTYMNLSGEAVQRVMQHWKLKIGNLIIIHDDLDIPLGKFKLEQGHGPMSHGGLKSIEEKVGKNFWRIRIGVENRTSENRIPGEEYVLQDFNDEEIKIIRDLFPILFQRLEQLSSKTI